MSRNDVPGTGARLRLDVLGPLRVLGADDRDLTPAGKLPRRLLTMLVLRRGRVLPLDVAAEVLWPRGRPADPVAALQNHVSRIRQVLPPGVIESVGDGYRIDPAAVDVDADRLAAALGLASSDPAALAEVEATLRRWRGPAYADLDDVAEARIETERVEELRVRAHELRARVLLANGSVDGLAVELQALADEHPMREQPRALLMETLAASGRVADALRVYDDFRRLLADDLGIEPSPALAARHRELLTQSAPVDWSPENRLPLATTALIGRAELVAELTTQSQAARLLSLVGPGGVGKTRILLELGRRWAATRTDVPVVLCELSRADESSAADLVSAALGIDVRPGTPIPERIASVIADSELIVLLDNCEHVLAPIAQLADHVLTHCPNIRAIATSRERLRISGEQIHVVPPLTVEDAVQLFLARARDVTGDATLRPDVDRIGWIVGELDRLPLAIELAAARMHSHDIDEIAAGLDRRFEFLSTGYRTSSRHGSLAAAVSWSFALLDDELKETFTDVSVFAGAFDVTGAAAVCALERATAGERLAQLVERSLVTRIPQRRYALLETLRTYGGEQLATADRRDSVRERHALYLIDWAENANKRLSESDAAVIGQVDETVPELLRALDWLLDHQRVASAGRLVVALIDYCFLRLRPDVLVWAERVAAADPGDDSPFAAEMWAAAAYAAWMAGDVNVCGIRARRALRVAQRVGGPVPPRVSAANGGFDLFEGRLSESAAWYRSAAEAAALSEPTYRPFAAASELLALGYAQAPSAEALGAALIGELGDLVSPHAAYVWYCAGEADLAAGLDSRARDRFDRALQIADATNAGFVVGVAGASKASIDMRLGTDLEAVARDYANLIRHWRRAGMWSTQWTMLRSIAVLLDRLGRWRDAAVLEGAIRSSTTGHRVFGTDEVVLAALSDRLGESMGVEAYAAARAQGAALDGDALLEFALRSL